MWFRLLFNVNAWDAEAAAGARAGQAVSYYASSSRQVLKDAAVTAGSDWWQSTGAAPTKDSIGDGVCSALATPTRRGDAHHDDDRQAGQDAEQHSWKLKRDVWQARPPRT